MSSSCPFRITADPTHVVLDAQRQGEVALSVSNATGEPVRGHAKVVPTESHQAWWLSLEGDAERDFGPHQTLEFKVGVAPLAPAEQGTGADLAFDSEPLVRDTSFDLHVERPGDPGPRVVRRLALRVRVVAD